MAAEFEVSTKTIQRDLDFMRDRLRLPIVYDEKRFGFLYARPIDHPPISFVEVKKESRRWGKNNHFAPPSWASDSVDQPPVNEGGVAIRIQFDAQVAADVEVLASFPLQELKALAGGGIELKAKPDSVVGLERWILSWGTYARVVEPDWLRRRIQKVARAILNSYRIH